MIELTEQQQRELREGGWPPRVRNPATAETFVLLHMDMFERVRALLEAEDDIAAVEEMSSLAGEIFDRDEPSSRENA